MSFRLWGKACSCTVRYVHSLSGCCCCWKVCTSSRADKMAYSFPASEGHRRGQLDRLASVHDLVTLQTNHHRADYRARRVRRSATHLSFFLIFYKISPSLACPNLAACGIAICYYEFYTALYNNDGRYLTTTTDLTLFAILGGLVTNLYTTTLIVGRMWSVRRKIFSLSPCDIQR